MPRVVDREARRAELVTAAATVFAQRGVANTAVSDIVKQAGVAQGTFYLYFDSKDDVVLAVVERLAGGLVDHAVTLVEAGSTAVDKLLILRDVFSDAAARQDAAELVDLMHRPENRALHDRFAQDMTPRLVPLVHAVVEQGVAEGAFDVDDTMTAAWFVLAGMQSAELAGPPPAEMPAALAKATDLVLRGLGYERPRP